MQIFVAEVAHQANVDIEEFVFFHTDTKVATPEGDQP